MNALELTRISAQHSFSENDAAAVNAEWGFHTIYAPEEGGNHPIPRDQAMANGRPDSMAFVAPANGARCIWRCTPPRLTSTPFRNDFDARRDILDRSSHALQHRPALGGQLVARFCATTEADPVLEDIDAASPRSALDLLARIQQHTAHIGVRTFNGTSTATPEQLNLFDALSLPKPA